MPQNRKPERPKIPAGKLDAKRRARWKGILVLLAAAVIGLGGYFGLADGSDASYAPEDVVREQPIHAVHEMGGGPRISFPAAGQPQPRIEIPKASHGFGTIGPKDVVTETFVIRNTGQAPLTIARAFTTCGCTTADISARVIPPGKVALVTVRFDAGFHDTRGQTVQRGVIIESNDRDNPKAEIWVHASVGSF